jgi:Putative zinc-finger
VNPDPFAQLDAAYVMGGLEPGERADFEQHLMTCAACRARVEDAAATIALIGAAGPFGDIGDAFAPADVPDTLLPGLLRRARHEHARRRVVTGALAGLVAACLVTLAVLIWPTSGSGRPAPQALQAVRTSPVHATAVLESRAWGTEIDLKCRYSTGVHAYVPYELRVIDRDGTSHDAGSWTLAPGQVTDFTGGTAVPRAQIAKVQVTLSDGTPILQLTL